MAFVCDRLARETLHGLATRCFDGLAGAGALIKAHEGFGGALAGGSADETLKAVGAGLQQHGEALAAGTAQVLANISEATGLELEEGVVDPGLARRAAAERDRTLRTKLVEAQVALNGLDAACEAHLGRLRLHLEDEVGASYGSDRGDPAVAKLLEAVRRWGAEARQERRGGAREGWAALASTALAGHRAVDRGPRRRRRARAPRSATPTRLPRTLGLRRGAPEPGRVDRVEIKSSRRHRVGSSRQPPRHRRDACSMAAVWYVTIRLSQHGALEMGPFTRASGPTRGAAGRGRVRAACDGASHASSGAARRTAAAAGDALLGRGTGPA